MAHRSSVLFRYLLLPFICCLYSFRPFGSEKNKIKNLLSRLLTFSLAQDYPMQLHIKNSDPCFRISPYPSRKTFCSRKLVPFFFFSHKKLQLYYSCNIKYMSVCSNTPCHSSQINHFKYCLQRNPLLKVIMTTQNFSL